jgi:hypothetical protein
MNIDWPRATTWVVPPYVSWTRNSADTYVVVVRVTNACRRQYQKMTNHFFVELPVQLFSVMNLGVAGHDAKRWPNKWPWADFIGHSEPLTTIASQGITRGGAQNTS